MPNVSLSNQTDITILVKVDGNDLQYFLLDSLTVLNADNNETVEDTFASTPSDETVSVAVVSTDGPVLVTNTNSSTHWVASHQTSGGVTFYWAQRSLQVPTSSSGPKEVSFNVKVGDSSSDPTVIISRTGAGNLAVRAMPRRG